MRRMIIIIGPLVALLAVSSWYFGGRLIDSYLNTESDTLRQSEPSVTNGLQMYEVNFKPTCSCEDFASPADARRALENRYKSAGLWCYNSKVIRREAKLNGEGQKIGIRIAAVIGCGVEGQQFATIWSTEGPKFCEITAPFLYQAESLEQTSTR